MRDIRVDLQERLQALSSDREKLKREFERRISELDSIETGIKVLLQRESVQFASHPNGNGRGGANIAANITFDEAVAAGSTELARLILQTLGRSDMPLSLDQLKQAAEQAEFDFGAKAPGRVIHWALVGMAQGGSVEKRDDKWQLKREA